MDHTYQCLRFSVGLFLIKCKVEEKKKIGCENRGGDIGGENRRGEEGREGRKENMETDCKVHDFDSSKYVYI